MTLASVDGRRGAGGGSLPTRPSVHRVTLPLIPPSTNHLYRTVHVPPWSRASFLEAADMLRRGALPWKKLMARLMGRRAPSKELREFKKLAGIFLRRGIPIIAGPVELEFHIWGGKGWLRSGDISNRIKAVEDTLVATDRITSDDCRVVRAVSIRYHGRQEHCEVKGMKPTKTNQGKLQARMVVNVREVGS